MLLHGDGLAQLANTYYAAVHFPATAAFLVWLYLRHPAHYVWARRVLAGITGAALVVHLAFPLAPPRMLAATGLVDTGRVYGPSVYGPPHTDQLSNQFAAMPSLHFGWALMVAIGLIVAGRSRLRWLGLLHPLVTLLVIVGTANHFWLDALVAGALLGLALAVTRPQGRARVRAASEVRAPSQGRAPSDVRPTDESDAGVGTDAATGTDGVAGTDGMTGTAREPAGSAAASGTELVEAGR